ncbi:uncharacterized protein CANTADRAFT_326242 [Suhomyces tanzawaensis NRRL Y-17324]|uniref:Uncharacterized protein n=1 Tax=Suhomyces tanzawaensis NRRL Y-17324 TaxID=984487 RepID=A0A1E4SC81_9ASCO|nr:uncharacterized protein CANTADRAFT_326242 [Suhomyces tanzawaensis NRRL Y-17324]ODV77086.1 hypothetical protein CANTADRAFT_326242 [Suhomyces tanzawaensis NRRL Y-17324]
MENIPPQPVILPRSKSSACLLWHHGCSNPKSHYIQIKEYRLWINRCTILLHPVKINYCSIILQPTPAIHFNASRSIRTSTDLSHYCYSPNRLQFPLYLLSTRH